jgi:hypothetical protein
MPLETAARPSPHPSHSWPVWARRLRPPRVAWPYFLIAAALLVLSEILWLWHSWPVRQVLDAEQAIAGVSI